MAKLITLIGIGLVVVEEACNVDEEEDAPVDVGGQRATGVDGDAHMVTGPGVHGADGVHGAGGGKHPGDDRRHPVAIAHLTLSFAISSLVASAAS